MEQSTKRKKIATIRLTLLANRAAPSPILGQALGQYGLNIANFCKNFNEKTRNIREHVYIPTRVEVYRMPSQNSFEITVKSPSSTYLLKQTAANLSKGSSTSRGRFILLKEIYHLAIFKKCDLMHLNLKAICKTFIGSAKSIGLILR